MIIETGARAYGPQSFTFQRARLLGVWRHFRWAGPKWILGPALQLAKSPLDINTSFAIRTHTFLTTFTHGLFMQIGDKPALRLLVVAAAALVDGQGRVLLAQRPAGKTFAGLWEFPGGKLEPGEGPEVALARELREELDVEVQTQDMAPFAFASHGYADFHLMMPLYVVRRWSGEPRAVEGGAVTWAALEALSDFDMPPADAPLVAELQKRGLAQ